MNRCSSSSSLSVFAHRGDDRVNGVLRVVEWDGVAGAPGELSADTGNHAVFVVVFGGGVADFLVGSLEGLDFGHEVLGFEVRDLAHITQVSQGLELLQVHGVVHEVQHKVVLHGDVEGLHLFGGVAALGDGALNSVVGIHECLVLGVDLVDNALGVNALLAAFPVDGLGVGGGSSVVEVEDGLKLRLRVLGLTGDGGGVKALGAKLVLTPAPLAMKGAIKKAEDIKASLGENAYMLQQFNNPDNVKIHVETTGPEIWEQTDGKIDVFLGGVGTGGTITGTSKFLKSKNKDMKTVAVEPAESPVMSGGKPGPHKIQGIGAGFIPNNCDMDIVDEVIQVSSADAMAMARRLAKEEGVLCGISSGAAVHAAIEVGKRADMKGKRIVCIIPSFGERYLSTALFAELLEESKNQAAEEVTL